MSMKRVLCLMCLMACGGGSVDVPEGTASGVDSTGPTGSNTSSSTPSGSIQGDCTVAPVAVQDEMRGMTVAGLSRQYRLTVPPAAAGEAMPILMGFHGADGRNYPFQQEQEFEAISLEDNVILVFPLSELVPPNEGEWQLNTPSNATHDIDFVEAILDELSTEYCVDTGRVYATGYSIGSMFSYEVACQLSDRFSAIASYAGTMPVNPNTCPVEGNLALMHLHGRDDWLIDYDLPWDWKEWDPVGTMMDIPSLVDFWSEQQGCQTVDETLDSWGVHQVHSDCNGSVRVEHYGLAGVQHEWPEKINGTTTARVIWDFVSEFSRP